MAEEIKNKKIRTAFIKYGGLSVGGSELWLQKIAANLPRDTYDIDFFYCDASPYIGSDYIHTDTHPDRLKYMQDHGVNLIKFIVGAKDVRTRKHIWKDTNFWDLFDASKYDLVQTVKAGPAEYPYYLIDLPVVEIVALAVGPDPSKNIAWSFHSSPWQRAQWVRLGGSIQKSSVLPAPLDPVLTSENLRAELGLSQDAVVAGFHQRASDEIWSPIPLAAFAACQKKESVKDWHFILKGGSEKYKIQAKELQLKNIHFIASDGDPVQVSRFLNTLDFFSHGRKDGETFGAVLAEAMMHGKPCLSHWSLIANAQPETMGPAGIFALNEKEYQQAMHVLFENKAWRDALAKRASEYAQSHYSIGNCIATLDEKYHDILNLPFVSEKKEEIPYGYSDMGFLYAGNMDDPTAIAHHVLMGGVPEEFEIAVVKSLLDGVRTFVDIGANTGLYCFVAAKQMPDTSHIYAFEPQKDCVDTLNTTISLNNWEKKLTVLPVGLSDTEGNKTFYLSGTGSSLDDTFIGEKTKSITIYTDTFDNQAAKNSIKNIDFIKIDVEGQELNVLKGAEQTIKSNIPILFIEIAGTIRQRNFVNIHYKETIEWLQSHGYQIWRCDKNSLKQVSSDIIPEHVSMFICLHTEKHARFVKKLFTSAEIYKKNAYIFGMKKSKINKVTSLLFHPKVLAKKILFKLGM